MPCGAGDSRTRQDQPRKPGTRLESPATLGRKCWAFAYLAQQAGVLGTLEEALAKANLSGTHFISGYHRSVAPTMALCTKVESSCFVNATPVPAHCPGLLLEFRAGFERENLKRGGHIKYPF